MELEAIITPYLFIDNKTTKGRNKKNLGAESFQEPVCLPKVSHIEIYSGSKQKGGEMRIFIRFCVGTSKGTS